MNRKMSIERKGGFWVPQGKSIGFKKSDLS
jgi:hypothetical protein